MCNGASCQQRSTCVGCGGRPQDEMSGFLPDPRDLLRRASQFVSDTPSPLTVASRLGLVPWWVRWAQSGGAPAAPASPPTPTPPVAPRADPRIAAAVRIAREEYARWGSGAKHESRDAKIRPVLIGYWRTILSASEAERSVNDGSAWSAAFISWVLKRAGFTAAEFRFASMHSTYVAAGKAAAANNDTSKFRTYRINDPIHGRPHVGDIICRDRGAPCGGTTYDNVESGRKTHCDLVVEVASDHIKVIGGNVSGPACPRDGCTVNERRLRLDANGFVVAQQSPRACRHIAIMKPPMVLSIAPISNEFETGPVGAVRAPIAPAGRFATLAANVPGKRPFRYTFTANDALWLARMVMGEAGTASPADQAAIVWAAFNNYALYWHRRRSSFAGFIRLYSTPLQPVLVNWQAAKRHADNPKKFVRTGGFYEEAPTVPKGQLARHLTLQKTPWNKIPAAVRTIVEQAVGGTLANPGIGNATKWWGTRYLYKKPACGPKGPAHDQCLYAAWEKFTRNFTSDGTVRWIGPVQGLDQYRYNALYLENRARNLPADVVRVVR